MTSGELPHLSCLLYYGHAHPTQGSALLQLPLNGAISGAFWQRPWSVLYMSYGPWLLLTWEISQQPVYGCQQHSLRAV